MTAPDPVLEPAALEFAEATAHPPFLYELSIDEGRRTVHAVQDGEIDAPDADVTRLTIPGGLDGTVDLTIYRPAGVTGPLPVVLYTHGAGWVFGDTHTHDRLVRELTARCRSRHGVPRVPSRSRGPVPARHRGGLRRPWSGSPPTARSTDLDGTRIAVAGDSVGGNMSAAVTLHGQGARRTAAHCAAALLPRHRRLVRHRLLPPVRGGLLAAPGRPCCGSGTSTRRDPDQRAEITASPLRATLEELAGLPPALVITGEADVLRDEGEAYAARLRAAGVPVTAVRYGGAIHDFVMVNSLRDTQAARAATAQGGEFLRAALHDR